MTAAVATFGLFLQASAARRPPLARRLALLASVLAHVGLLLAALLLWASPPARPAPPPEPILLRLPRLGRPPAAPPSPPPPRPARRPPRPAALVQPTPLVQPPPVEESAPPPEEASVAAEAAPDDGPADPAPAEPAPSGPPAPFAAAGDGALELREVARAPQVLEQVKPEYPREARWKRLAGLVVLRVVVGTDGRIDRSKTRVVQSIPELDAAAIAAIERWRFAPAIGHAGQPVRVVIDVPVRFSLR